MVVGTDAEDSLPILVSPSQADVPIPCWCPHLMLVSPSQADIPIPGQCPHPRPMSPPQADVPLSLCWCCSLSDLPREQVQLRGRPAGSVSKSGSVRVMGTAQHPPPHSTSSSSPSSTQILVQPGRRNMAPGYSPVGCPSTVALGTGLGAQAWWHHVPSPGRLQPGPAAGWWLSMGLPQPAQPGPWGLQWPRWGQGSSQPQAQWLDPEHQPRGVTCPPPSVRGPGPVSRPGPGAPLPSADGNIFFLSMGLQQGGWQEKTSCLGGLFITCCQQGRPDRPAASPLAS